MAGHVKHWAKRRRRWLWWAWWISQESCGGCHYRGWPCPGARLTDPLPPPVAQLPVVRARAAVPEPPQRVLVRPYNAARYAGWLPPSPPAGQHRAAP
jgi:hypothetical protein